MATLRHEALYREAIHPVLALLPPLLGALAAASILEDLLARDILTPVLVLAVLLAGVTETVVGNLVASHRAGWDARLREFLLVAGVAYLVFALTAAEAAGSAGAAAGAAGAAGLARRLAPRIEVVLPVVLVAGAWFAVHRRHEGFRPREDFLRSVRGRRGRQLRHTMRDTRGFATDILLRLREMNTSAALGFVLLLLASAVVWASEQSVTVRSLALLAAYGPAAVLTSAVVNAFRQEFAVYGEGIRVPNRLLRRLVTSAGVLVGAALLLSLPFARNASPFSPLALAAAFDAVRSWFSALPAAEMPEAQRFTLPPMEGFLGDYGISPRMLALSRFWDTFSRVFRAVALTLAAIGALVFVVWPVFSRRFRRQVRAAHLGRRALALLFGILDVGAAATRTLGRLLRRVLHAGPGRTARGRGPGGDAAAAGSHRRAQPTPAVTPPLRVRRQRHVIRGVIEEIAEEGKKKGAPREPYHTAREYSRLLLQRYPDLADALSAVVATAEQALYSNHRLARADIRRFVTAARSVLRRLKEAEPSGA